MLLGSVEAPLVVAARHRQKQRCRVRFEPLLAHGVPIQRPGKAGEDGIPVGVGVVHRQVDLGDRQGFGKRNHKRVRKDGVGDPHMGEFVCHGAQGREPHAEIGGFHANLGLVELAHDARHGPAFAIHFTGGARAELPPGLVVACFSQ